MKKSFVLPALAGIWFVPLIVNAQFAGSVVSYTSGAGVAGGYTDPNSALGAPALANPDPYGGPIDPFNAPYLPDQIIGIGAGGSLTLQFNSPILNAASNPYGLDFIVFGHAGFNEDFGAGTAVDGSLYTGGTSDVRVSVSADGINFFTLNPVLTPQVDGLYPTDSAGNPLIPVNPSLTAADFAGQDLAGIRALYGGSAGGAGFDISWALNGASQSVSLSSVDFVRLDVVSGVAYVDSVSAVPEPAAVVLVCAAAGAIFLRRHRK